jgi:hypothetical protein
MAEVRKRPILFSGPMVRAILKEIEKPGTGKTQTRRLFHHDPSRTVVRTAYTPGDRLWVRETWNAIHLMEEDLRVPDEIPTESYEGYWTPVYAATDPQAMDHPDDRGFKWRPSIHMPRWASRISLEVTGVRVERLQDISVMDAKAEGFSAVTKDGSLFKYGIPDRDGLPGTDNDGWPWADWERDPRKAYSRLWELINGKRTPWASNPWVWVIEFRPYLHDCGELVSPPEEE